MAVLVTGGAGYIGSVFVEQLLAAGESVVVLDDLSRGHRAAVDSRARFYQGQTGDRALVARLASDHGMNEAGAASGTGPPATSVLPLTSMTVIRIAALSKSSSILVEDGPHYPAALMNSSHIGLLQQAGRSYKQAQPAADLSRLTNVTTPFGPSRAWLVHWKSGFHTGKVLPCAVIRATSRVNFQGPNHPH